jgi:tetratricopeptide (TPR) repeat protein
LAHSSQPNEVLLAASRGYSYLQEDEESARLLLKLADLAQGTSLAEEIAPSLFETIVSAKSPRQRLARAESYVRNFPDGRMAFRAARTWLRAQAEAPGSGSAPLQTSVLAMLADGDHRQLQAAAASWLIEKQKDPERAIALLERSLRNLEEDGWASIPPYFTEELWREQVEHERGRCHYLLGRARLQKGDLAGARTDLAAALHGYSDPGAVHHYFAVLERQAGSEEETIQHLRKALELSSALGKTEELLSSVLREARGYEGAAADYFRQRENVVVFTNVTAAAGLAGVSAQRVAWGDYDNDGYDDLFLARGRLFRNRGDGTFVDATQETGLVGLGKSNGGLWGDYDGDGYLDLLVTARRGNSLWRNAAGSGFVDVTATAFGDTEEGYTQAGAWGDLDNDGDLDIYLANYERRGVTRGLCSQDQLLRNDGDGAFTDVTTQAGMLSEEPMCGRGVTWSDADNDGWQDIIVANYRLDPNFVWRNQGDGSFVDVAAERGLQGREVAGAYGHTIGPVAGDLDGDLDTDVYLSNLAHPRYIEFSDKSMLLMNPGGPDPVFVNRFSESGIAFDETSSDPALADVDNDGDLDLYVTSIYRGRTSRLYLNDGHGRFQDHSWLSGTRVQNGWGAAFADFDDDGDPDLLIASRDGVQLFRNEGTTNHWIKVRIEDQGCNRFGVGAKVSVRRGGRVQIREVTAGRGTGSQDSVTVIFGLGSGEEPIDIEARTLCGSTLRETVFSANRTVVLRQPSADPAAEAAQYVPAAEPARFVDQHGRSPSPSVETMASGLAGVVGVGL